MKHVDISNNLLLLQNMIKRDPSLYYEEFSNQFDYYKAVVKFFMTKPTEFNQELADLVMFIAQVSACYKSHLAEFPGELMHILKENYDYLNAEMRMCFCKALILIRSRGLIESVDLIPLFFILLRAKDKILRNHLQTFIISDIKKMNIKHKNMKLNSTLQNLMFNILTDTYAVASKVSLDIMIELYRKNIWNDTKTVNAIATACFSKVNKILVAAHQFFLGSDEESEEKDSSDSEDDNVPNVKDVMAANKVNKKSRRRMKNLKRAKQAMKRSKKKKQKEVFDFSAIHLLHDPQGMAEKLLKMLYEMNERYEIKMMVMNLISRLVGVHQLILLNYYAFLIRYLTPHQREVTKILTFAAQAAHECVPPDAIEPVVKTIAYNFITERNSGEAITVGINAIREICARCPLAISQDLLLDIAEYKSYKNKNVMMAARSVIQLFRKINPHMLSRKFRCRPTEATKEIDSLEYGALKAKSYIPGTEVLSVEPLNEDDIEKAPDDNEDNDSDGSWIDVSHSEDELNVDEENEDKKDKVSMKGEEASDEENEDKKDKVTMEGEEASDEENVNDSEEDSDNKEDKNDEVKEDQGDIIKSKDKNNKKNSNSDKDVTDEIDDKQKAMIVSQSRLLSQEEFTKIKAVQIAKEVKFAKGKKRKVQEVEINEKEIVSLKDIEKLHKRSKADKESRLASVMEGREGREKFAKKKKKINPHASKTQKEHNKNKAFMMIKHKVRSKQKRSFKDKQVALRNALLKRKRHK